MWTGVWPASRVPPQILSGVVRDCAPPPSKHGWRAGILIEHALSPQLPARHPLFIQFNCATAVDTRITYVVPRPTLNPPKNNEMLYILNSCSINIYIYIYHFIRLNVFFITACVLLFILKIRFPVGNSISKHELHKQYIYATMPDIA